MKKDRKQNAVWSQDAIGERLRLFRQLVGKSQSELAGDIKQSTGFVKMFELGQWQGRPPDFKEIYRDYGLNSTWLMTGKQDIFISKGVKTPDYIYILAALKNCSHPLLVQLKELLLNFYAQGSREELLKNLEELEG